MNHIHSRKVSHRDLKLENILLDRNFNLRVIDYGYAISFEKLMDPKTGRTAVGTPHYMPPEVQNKELI